MDATVATAKQSLPFNASSTHPFAILPVEIVNEIFMHCLPGNIEASQPTPTEAPLLLCHVSSYWRNAAIADPRLWKRLTLNPKTMRQISSLEPISRTTRQMVEQALLWLANAKDLGLDIDLNVPIPTFHVDDSESEVFGPTFADVCEKWNTFILPILVQQASHFKTLRLSFGVVSLLHSFFFAEEQVNLRKLQSLTIRGDRLQITADDAPSTHPPPPNQITTGGNSKKMTVQGFASAAQLTKVAILVKNRSPFPLQLPFNFLPWSQLTHLMITMPCSGSFWKRVLCLCSQLEAGYINIEYGVAPGDCDPPLPSAGYIELPRLRMLDVTFHDEFTSAYFEDFRFPVLQRMLVACDFGSGFPTLTWLPSGLNSTFLQELRSLTSLTLSYQNMVETELVGMLKYTVQLEELVLDSYLVDHKVFFQALVVKSDETKPLVPKLQVFRFFVEYFADVPPTTFDEEDFLAVMTSRSELAREVASGLPDEPEPEPKVQEDNDDDDGDGRYSFMSDSDMDEDEDEKEGLVNQDMEVPISTAPTTIQPPPTATTPLTPKPTVPRPPLPPVCKLVTHIRQVELSTDANEPTFFRRLEKFEAGVNKYHETHSEGSPLPILAFKLEFSSPSEWALQDGEPSWF